MAVTSAVILPQVGERGIGQSRGGLAQQLILWVPVLVLGEVTERPEGVEAGTASLVGTDRERIVGATSRLLEDERAYESMAKAVNRRTPPERCSPLFFAHSSISKASTNWPAL